MSRQSESSTRGIEWGLFGTGIALAAINFVVCVYLKLTGDLNPLLAAAPLWIGSLAFLGFAVMCAASKFSSGARLSVISIGLSMIVISLEVSIAILFWRYVIHRESQRIASPDGQHKVYWYPEGLIDKTTYVVLLSSEGDVQGRILAKFCDAKLVDAVSWKSNTELTVSTTAGPYLINIGGSPDATIECL